MCPVKRFATIPLVCALILAAACGNGGDEAEDLREEIERLETQLAEAAATVEALQAVGDDGGVYPPQVRDEFLAACIAERGPGQSTTAFWRYCTCTLEYLEAELSLSEFQQIEQRILDGEDMPPELWDAVAACERHLR